jgi:hypothetical protein
MRNFKEPHHEPTQTSVAGKPANITFYYRIYVVSFFKNKLEADIFWDGLFRN